jgi:hypothetical protein
MFFIGFCILLWALIASNAQMDVFGWMMVAGAGWFCGFMDGRMVERRDKEPGRGIPTDGEPAVPVDPTDASLFRS